MAPRQWGRAPGLEDLEALAATAFQALPEEFRAACGDVVFKIVDFPSEGVLVEMGLETEFDLLGLFEGTGRPQAGETRTGDLPNVIWLYRRPILDYWAEFDETLEGVVTHVLIHEIGHHLGFSDDDMERIERAAE
jgi:predicted Zn-dependent protease with MMP-like domain